jgi:hypothetical protein
MTRLAYKNPVITGFDLMLMRSLYLVVSFSVMTGVFTIFSGNGNALTIFAYDSIGGSAFAAMFFLGWVDLKRKTTYPSWKIGVRRIQMHRHWMINHAFKDEITPRMRRIYSWALVAAACFAGEMVVIITTLAMAIVCALALRIIVPLLPFLARFILSLHQ